MDVSDGLALDLAPPGGRLRGGVRASTPCPAPPGRPLDEALGGGEDYELVMATGQPQELVAAFSAAGLAPPVNVGRIAEVASRRLLDGVPLAAIGWQHRL